MTQKIFKMMLAVGSCWALTACDPIAATLVSFEPFQLNTTDGGNLNFNGKGESAGVLLDIRERSKGRTSLLQVIFNKDQKNEKTVEFALDRAVTDSNFDISKLEGISMAAGGDISEQPVGYKVLKSTYTYPDSTQWTDVESCEIRDYVDHCFDTVDRDGRRRRECRREEFIYHGTRQVVKHWAGYVQSFKIDLTDTAGRVVGDLHGSLDKTYVSRNEGACYR